MATALVTGIKKLVAVSLKVIAGISLVTVTASFLLTRPLVSVFARPDNSVYELAVTGNRICTIALFLSALIYLQALSVFMFLKYRKRYGY